MGRHWFIRFVDPVNAMSCRAISCFVVNWSSCRFCIAAMDMTLYPPSASYVKAAFAVLSSVTAMSPCHCGFIMQPVLQKQTTEVARIKHRRMIEDFLVKGSMSYGQETTVFYAKPDAGPRDGRPLSHVCVLTTNNTYSETPWSESDAVSAGRVGPFPLIKVADMLGYDEATRPSAGARVEQKLTSSNLLSLLFFNLQKSCSSKRETGSSMFWDLSFVQSGPTCNLRRGVPCAQALMASMLSGMDVKDNDKVVWLDIIPNRPASEHVEVKTNTFQLFSHLRPLSECIYPKFLRTSQVCWICTCSFEDLAGPCSNWSKDAVCGLDSGREVAGYPHSVGIPSLRQLGNLCKFVQSFSPPARRGLLDFIRAVVLLLLLQFLLDHVCINFHLHFRLANSSPSSSPTSELSAHCWTSTPGTFSAQCALLDLNLGPS